MDSTTAAVLGILVLATLVRALTGFGNALVAMPLLALVVDVKTAAPVVALTAMVTAVYMLVAERRHLCIGSAGRILAGALLGTPIGLWFLKGSREQTVQLALAVLILVFALYNLLRPRLLEIRSDRWAYAAGFVAGILGGAYNTNGPPIVIYGTMRGWEPRMFRATLQGFFLPAGILVITGHGMAGLWTPQVWRYTLLALPGILATLVIAHRFAGRIPEKRFRKLVLSVLLGSALLLAWKALHHPARPDAAARRTTGRISSVSLPG